MFLLHFTFLCPKLRHSKNNVASAKVMMYGWAKRQENHTTTPEKMLTLLDVVNLSNPNQSLGSKMSIGSVEDSEKEVAD